MPMLLRQSTIRCRAWPARPRFWPAGRASYGRDMAVRPARGPRPARAGLGPAVKPQQPAAVSRVVGPVLLAGPRLCRPAVNGQSLDSARLLGRPLVSHKKK